jgi:hypothetical protein
MKSRRTLDTDTPTYQDVLDEAIEETFPASDPIAPAVEHAGVPVSTRRNRIDWKLARNAGSATTTGQRAAAGEMDARTPARPWTASITRSSAAWGASG